MLTDIVAVIISYLDRCVDMKTAEEVCIIYDLSKEERNVVDVMWIKESHVKIAIKQSDVNPVYLKRLMKTAKECHFMNGKIHRGGGRLRDGDQPAIVYKNGKKEWYQNGKLHRDGDKPAVIDADGTQRWYQNGELHRKLGLPVIFPGSNWSDNEDDEYNSE